MARKGRAAAGRSAERPPQAEAYHSAAQPPAHGTRDAGGTVVNLWISLLADLIAQEINSEPQRNDDDAEAPAR